MLKPRSEQLIERNSKSSPFTYITNYQADQAVGVWC